MADAIERDPLIAALQDAYAFQRKLINEHGVEGDARRQILDDTAQRSVDPICAILADARVAARISSDSEYAMRVAALADLTVGLGPLVRSQAGEIWDKVTVTWPARVGRVRARLEPPGDLARILGEIKAVRMKSKDVPVGVTAPDLVNELMSAITEDPAATAYVIGERPELLDELEVILDPGRRDHFQVFVAGSEWILRATFPHGVDTLDYPALPVRSALIDAVRWSETLTHRDPPGKLGGMGW